VRNVDEIPSLIDWDSYNQSLSTQRQSSIIEMHHHVSPLIFSHLRWPVVHDSMEYFGAEVQCIEMISFREDFKEWKPERWPENSQHSFHLSIVRLGQVGVSVPLGTHIWSYSMMKSNGDSSLFKRECKLRCLADLSTF
jgi:hypothetical protein